MRSYGRIPVRSGVGVAPSPDTTTPCRLSVPHPRLTDPHAPVDADVTTAPADRSRRVAQVVLLLDTRALDRPLDYAIPEHLADAVGVGSLVVCPLRQRRVLGIVIGLDPPSFGGRLASVAAVVADAPRVSGGLLTLGRWMAGYYAAPLAACLRLPLPPRAEDALRRSPDGRWHLAPIPAGRRQLIAREPADDAPGRRGAILEVLRACGGALPAAELCRRAGTTTPTLRSMGERGELRLIEGVWDPDDDPAPEADRPPDLSAEQESAVRELVAAADGGERARLLHGVTGSGKTEVYLRLIQAMRERGRTSIVLVPEIALTPQTAERLRARLGRGVEVWHSALTPAERSRADARIRDGRSDVVLGARSAVLAPVSDLGLIILDEEHDGSYKQDSTPRYDARQVAYRRALIDQALVVYGSATPRAESWNAIPRITLTTRADGAALPRVEIVDMRLEAPGPVSRPLAQAIQASLGRGEKTVLLLNRRGLARQILCRGCGWIGRCPSCDVPMVVHDRPPQVICHHCGLTRGIPALCPKCRSSDIIRQGSGTQGLEEALEVVAPGADIIRLDADITARRGELEARLARFARPGPAILLGTQMVAKGHDLPDVTVAGVLDADGPLQRPDFRGEERAFQLIVQLAGRAGRRGEPATVFVQAWEPRGRAVQLGARHDVTTFMDGEILRRRDHGFPPFGHLVRVVIDGPDEGDVVLIAGRLAEELAAGLPDARVLGPAVLHRVRSRTRRTVLVRAERAQDIAQPVRRMADAVTESAGTPDLRVIVDVDPQDT